MWKWCWAWSEGNPAPHFHDVSKWLESLITGSLHQQWHREVSSLEPLCHLLITERTWNHIQQHVVGKGKQGQVQHVGMEELAMVTQCPAPGTAVCLTHSWGHCSSKAGVPMHTCTGATALPTASGKVHDGFHLALEGHRTHCGVGLVQLKPLLSSSSTDCFRLTAAAAPTLELSSTCCLALLTPQVLLSQLQCTDN